MKSGERRVRKTCTLFLVALICILGIALMKDSKVYAESLRTGIITADTLNVRTGPGTSYSKVGTLYSKNQVYITGEQKDSGNTLWYEVVGESVQGWVSSTYVDVTKTVTVDFKEYLRLLGFPESYCSDLIALHAKYPNWKFEAQITNLDWNNVIKNESKLGVNLTHTSNPSSWKSVQTGAYDWTTGKWVGLDSSSWVAASEEIIKYYMDPRNFLDETYIFQFLRQSYDASDSSYQSNLTAMVQGTFLAGQFTETAKATVVSEETQTVAEGENSARAITKTYVSAILEAAKESQVSPYTLATMIIQEQGRNGTGSSISGKEPGYEGYYNFFNVGAYAVGGLTPVQKGLEYAKGSGSYGRPWDTVTKSIVGGAIYYGESYIKKGQDTIYLKKFNVQGNSPYTHQYMTNVQGAASEGQILSEAYAEAAQKVELTFKIPVYKNMPSAACTKPTGNSSPNYMLSSISVAGHSLTPTFSMYETSYSVIVPNETSSVSITAKAYDSKTTVSGVGKVNLSVGKNTVNVTAKAQNGSTRTYTILIIREEAEEKPPVQEPQAPVVPPTTVSSNSYKLDESGKKLTGIKTFPVTATEFAKGIQVSNGTVEILKADGTKQTGNVGTGNKVNVYDSTGALKYSYDVIIYGDANGDGKVNAQDLLVIQKNNIKVSDLKGVYLSASDVNKDGKVNARDLLAVQKHNIKIESIQQ